MRNTHPTYEQDLERVAKLLRRKALTAREVAEKLECCVPTAYQRIRALEQRGVRVLKKPTKKSRTGPPALAFVIKH